MFIAEGGTAEISISRNKPNVNTNRLFFFGLTVVGEIFKTEKKIKQYSMYYLFRARLIFNSSLGFIL